MYIIEYFHILSSAPFLWGVAVVVALLFFICMRMLEKMTFRLIGLPLLVAAVVATFFPTDTVICIERDTITGHCYSELGTGIVILFALSYCFAAVIYFIQLKVSLGR